ncbi:uncharacterized protein LOC121838220 [Ixodes scapularis]|uniref:uncharacterized protein LOC121838220 n=1 Tax=Ixodes scapularis TaxID=6945 RepID=UPI001C394D67|nr:uncharacterized protein LOC121838220 [Ixodes scapularis]
MNQSAAGTSSNGDGAFSTVQLRLPAIWAKNPRASFSQVEAQFHLWHITSQSARYYHVVSALPPEVADELDDVLASPPPDDAYNYIKRTILARKTESEASRLQQLLNTEELGDRRPSQLLHRMRQLLGEQASDTNTLILRELFLQRLPQGIRMTLAPATDLPLDRLAEMADRVAEYAAPALSSVTNDANQCSAMRALEARIDALTTAVAALGTKRNDSRRRRRSRSS